VLVWRGDCPFIQKAVNAQAAGAAAVIVVTDETGTLESVHFLFQCDALREVLLQAQS
jgi:molybdopterin-guanine dinucleotide biosynthesis protein A